MKKYFFVGAIFVLALFVVGVVSLRQRPVGPTVTPPAKTPELAALSAPSFPRPVADKQPTYVVPTITNSFPAYLPDYVVLPFSVGDAAGSLAAGLGFSGTPQTIVGPSGSTYLWVADASSLVASGNPLAVTYLSGKTASGVVVSSSAALEATARAVLARLALPPAPYELVKLPPRYFMTSGQDLVEVNGAPGATVVEVGYRYHLSNRPVYGSHPNESSVAIRLNAKEDVVSLTATVLPQIKRGEKSVAIAQAEDVSTRLSQNRGVLLYFFADTDKNNFTAPEYTVPIVSVGSVSLGYYYSPGAPSMSPVFLAEGTGQDDQTAKVVRFMTLVSALPSSE